jgi:hypothetical protein
MSGCERVDEIEDKSLEDFAKRKRIRVTNPKGARKMAVRTRRELLDRIAELEEENEELREKVDSIAEIVGEEEEEESEGE